MSRACFETPGDGLANVFQRLGDQCRYGLGKHRRGVARTSVQRGYRRGRSARQPGPCGPVRRPRIRATAPASVIVLDENIGEGQGLLHESGELESAA